MGTITAMSPGGIEASRDSVALLAELSWFLLAAMRRLEIPATLGGWPYAA
jgi:hypothetical protein